MLLSFFLLGEELTWLKATAMILIGVGTYLQIKGAIWTVVVLAMAWLIIFLQGKYKLVDISPCNAEQKI